MRTLTQRIGSRSLLSPVPLNLHLDLRTSPTVLNSMEHLIFSVSVESRVEGSATKRKVQWPELERDEPRKPLTLDENIVGLYRTALDAVPCVLYIYPLILVVKMVNAVSCLQISV